LAAKLAVRSFQRMSAFAAKEGKAIARIFQEDGEKYFRDLEAKIVEEIADQQGVIVDCGGGIALNPKNIELLKKNGAIFYLSVTAEEVYKNVKDQNTVPCSIPLTPK